MKFLYWFLLLSLVLTSTVRAEDSEDGVEETNYDDEEFDDDEDAVSSSDVTVKVLFPKHANKKFPLGEDITVLVGFHNNGEKTFNVSNIVAHLHSPFDYNYYIQNFTVKTLQASVGPNSQVSLEYTFKTDKTLEPLEFWFSAAVNYNRTDGRNFMHTLHNGTVELVEAIADANQKLVTYVLGVAALGVAAFLYSQSQKKTTSKKPSAAASSESEKPASWDDVAIYRPSKSQGAANKKNKKAAKTN